MTEQELREKRAYYRFTSALGKEIVSLLESNGWTDIMINPDGRVFIDTDDLREVDIRIPNRDSSLSSAAQELASYSGLAFNKSSDQGLDAIVPVSNWRVSFVNVPAVDGIAAVFRKPSDTIISMDEMVSSGTVTETQRDFLRDAVLKRKNIVLSGGTGSGKTTFMRSILTLIPPSERLLIIEDAPELRTESPNHVSIRVNSRYSYLDGIRQALRMRPDRIIVGECRMGDQALEMLKAWNTGHPGGLTTLHANSAEDALDRLEELLMEVSVSSLRPLVDRAVSVVVHMGRIGSKRRVAELLDKENKEIVR